MSNSLAGLVYYETTSFIKGAKIRRTTEHPKVRRIMGLEQEEAGGVPDFAAETRLRPRSLQHRPRREPLVSGNGAIPRIWVGQSRVRICHPMRDAQRRVTAQDPCISTP